MKTRDLGFLLLGVLAAWLWASHGKHQTDPGFQVQRENPGDGDGSKARQAAGGPGLIGTLMETHRTQRNIVHMALNSSLRRVTQQSDSIQVTSVQEQNGPQAEATPGAVALVPAMVEAPVRDGAGTGNGPKQRVRFGSRAGSRITMDGTANIIHTHWRVEGSIIGGYLEAGPDFPAGPASGSFPVTVDAQAKVFIPVNSLKSVAEDGTHFADAMDNVMYQRMKAGKFPRIEYYLTDLALKEPARGSGSASVFEAAGQLVLAGMTNAISMPVTVRPVSDQRLKLTGTTSVRMTSFGIRNLEVLEGVMKVGDEVKLSFEWLVAKREVGIR